MMNKIFVLSLCLIALTLSQPNCCQVNTISTTGNGQVNVAPDIATISVGVSETAATTIAALSKANAKISQLTTLLASSSIPTTDYSTSSISINPQYDYTNGSAVLTGQSASQTLTVTIKNLTPTKVADLITKFSTVNNVTINSLSFSNSNTAPANRQARQAAYADALSRAQTLVGQSGQKLGSIANMVDQNQDSYTPFSSNANLFRLQQASLQVPYG